MKSEIFDLKPEEILIRALKDIILASPELEQLIDQRAEMKIREKEFPGLLTRDQLAKIWQISKPTLDRMTDEELIEHGFRRMKIGVSVRFERIPSREFRR